MFIFLEAMAPERFSSEGVMKLGAITGLECPQMPWAARVLQCWVQWVIHFTVTLSLERFSLAYL